MASFCFTSNSYFSESITKSTSPFATMLPSLNLISFNLPDTSGLTSTFSAASTRPTKLLVVVSFSYFAILTGTRLGKFVPADVWANTEFAKATNIAPKKRNLITFNFFKLLFINLNSFPEAR